MEGLDDVDDDEVETLLARDCGRGPERKREELQAIPRLTVRLDWRHGFAVLTVLICTVLGAFIFFRSAADSIARYHFFGPQRNVYVHSEKRRSESLPGFFNSSYCPSLPKDTHPDAKVILFWNKFFDEENPYLHDNLAACRQRNCFLTNDRRHLLCAAAVIFHMRNLNSRDLPAQRDERQLYIFFLLESPEHTGLLLNQPPWPDFFNLTWTYRLDSDIFCPFYFERYQPTLWTNRSESREFLRKKYNKALIFSSNCHTSSRREDYIQKLRQYFPVDVIGSCGHIRCPKKDRECDNRVHMYKFYLSFENSNCKDYVTEKIFRPLNVHTIPVVLGGGNYTAMLPPHSFIPTSAYATPKDLADYLHFLTRNATAYEQYYDWKFEPKYPTLPAMIDADSVGTCQLCNMVHNNLLPTKIYHDIHSWWATNASCKSGP